MQTFVGRNESRLPAPMDLMSQPEVLMTLQPDYYRPRFEAIAELRKEDDGTLHRGNEFRRVASLVNVPIALAVKMQNPEFLRDKRQFYRWLRGPGAPYKTYDKHGGSRPSVTFTGGEQIAT